MRAASHHLGRQHIEDVLGETNGARIGVAGEPAYTEIRPTEPPKEQVSRGLVRMLALQVADLEEAPITVALSQRRGNGAAAARLLGMSRAKLYGRLQAMHHTHPIV
jgi:DNA-binding NtrC family response regulator